MKRVLFAVTLLLLLVSTSAFAQVTAGLSGTVADASGALIPGVEVTAKNINTGISNTTVTNETGSFVILSLQPGNYTLTAALTGFQTATYNQVTLGEGQQVRLNFNLQVAAAAGQNVEVTIAADTVLSTTSASVGNVLPERDVLSMPMLNRNVLDLVATTAGVVFTPNAFSAQPGSSMVANFGGTGPDAVNTTRDGLVTNDGRYNSSNGAYSGIFTSPDMVEEVKVTANNIDPTLGRGAAQVQMRTRAGTNEFHGAGFYTNNNSALNAQNYFNNLQNAPKNFVNRNQYGARLGGPIMKNKMFFFVLTDNQRYLDKRLVTSTVLTDSARAGIFRFMNNGQRNGAANSTAPSVDVNGNPLNPGAVSQFNEFSDVKDPFRTGIDQTWVAPQYLTRMPHPNTYLNGTTGAGVATAFDGLNTAGFSWLLPENGLDGSTGASPDTNRNHLTARIDYQINNKNKVNFVMTREKDWGVSQQTGEPDFPTGQFGQLQRLPYFYSGAFTSTISATMLNEFRIGKKRDSWVGSSGLDSGCCLNASESTRTAAAQALYSSYPQVPGSFVYMTNALGLGNYVQFGVAAPRVTSSPYTQIGDTISFTKGAHSFSAGFDFDWAGSYGANSGNTQTTRPNATIGISTTNPSLITAAQPYAKGINASDITTASNLLAQLAGSVSQITHMVYLETANQPAFTNYTQDYLFYRYQHENDWDLFFKDNWKAGKNLTVILGMRYDKYGVPYDSFGLGGRYTSANGGGEAALFGCSGSSFSAMWTPGAGNCDSANPTLTGGEFVGKNSPQPGKLIHPNDWKDFGPSIGFSYNLPERTHTVLRGGYGINYAAAATFLTYSGDFGSLNGESQNLTATAFPTPGGYMSAGLIGSNQNLFPLSATIQPLQAIGLNQPLLSRSQSITGYADNWRAPYIQSFNLSIQHQLTRSLTMDVGWVGNKVTRVFLAHALNDVNVQTNGFLTAFNNIRAGGEDPLMTKIFNGVNFGPTIGTVGQGGLTAGVALRKSTTWQGNIANGQVGAMANQINTDSTSTTRGPGGLLLNGGLNQNFFVVNPQWSGVTLRDNSDNSTYNAFQSHVTKRFSQGVTGQVSYTFSKNLGDSGVRDQRNLSLSKGLLGVDRTHIITSNATYDLPFGKDRMFFSGAPGWADRVINGWQLSSIATWTSGAPIAWTGNGGLYNTAGNTPNLVSTMPKGQIFKGPGYVSYWNNLKTCGALASPTCTVTSPLPNFGGDANLPGKFTNQVLEDANNNIIMQNAQPGQLGSMPTFLPNIKGPGYLNFNMAATKSVKISEGKTFTLRADAVNVLNKPQWGAPTASFNGTSFGRITSALGNRTVTLDARIDF
jgi:hypothetical protein